MRDSFRYRFKVNTRPYVMHALESSCWQPIFIRFFESFEREIVVFCQGNECVLCSRHCHCAEYVAETLDSLSSKKFVGNVNKEKNVANVRVGQCWPFSESVVIGLGGAAKRDDERDVRHDEQVGEL